MDIAVTPAVERIARVLAGQRFSANAKGDDPSAADEVDAAWRDHRDDAVAVLKTLREPDAEMARAGDLATWQRMIAVALGEAQGEQEEFAEPGSEPFLEGP